MAEDDLVDGVVELQGLRERDALAAATERLPGCPFKGLASFEVDDAGVFFGRERLVADMVARLPGTRMMGVVGPSGSGKSSAMRGGLLAALADGVLPGSENWPLAVIRPATGRWRRSSERSPTCRRAAAGWSPWTSSRRCSRPAATSTSAPRSSTLWSGAPATRAAGRW